MAAKSQDLIVRITTQSDQAKRDLAAIDKAAKDAEKPIVLPVKADGVDKVESDLKGVGEAAEQAARQVEEIGRGGVGGGRLKPAVQDVDESTKTLERSASGTKNAFANLVGNTAQDVSGLSGAFGSLGVAVGQVAEYTADAANEGGGLTAALRGAASFAGPMLALAAASFAVQKVMGDMAKQSAEAKAANDALLKSWVDTTGSLKDWQSQLEDAFSAGTASKVEDFNLVISKTLEQTGDLDKTAVALGKLGFGIDDLGASMSAADRDFTAWSESVIRAAGLGDDFAEKLTWIVDNNEKLGDVLDSTKIAAANMLPPERRAEALRYAEALAQVKDDVEKIDTEKKAKDFLDLQASMEGMADVVKRAREENASEQDAAIQVTQAIHEQARAREANARAAEDGAKATADAGSIQEQAVRQLADAEQAVADAADKAKTAQDNWLVQNVDYEGKVDGFTKSLQDLTEQTEKQTKAGDEGAGSFEGNTKAALDNRDALRDVYSKATDVIQGMKDAGFSVDGARTAQDNMAQSAYDLAIKMGYPVEKAQEIKDKINQIPPSVTSDVRITEQGYADVKAKKDDLDEDMESTLFISGVLDRSLLDAVRQLPPGAFGSSVTPGAAVAPATGLRASAAPIPAPMGPEAVTGRSRASSAERAWTVTQPIVVNVNAGLVADTFQLQRAVVRGARSFQRLAGKRAA